MKFLVDVNIPQLLISYLSDLGHEVLDVKKTTNRNTSDAYVRNWARRERRIVLTYDKDFLVPGEVPQYISVIVFHFPKTKPKDTIPYVKSLLAKIVDGEIKAPFVVIISQEGLELIVKNPPGE